MKRIGKLNGKTVVQGDPNLVKQNEILYKQEPEGIILQERKKNNLENITAGGGGSSDSEILYYKFVDNNNTIEEGNPFTYGTLACSFVSNLIYYLNIISFKSNKEKFSGLTICKLLSVTGSQDVTKGDTYNELQICIREKNILGFSFLKSKTTNFNYKYIGEGEDVIVATYESPEGNLWVKFLAEFGFEEEQVPELSEEQQMYFKLLKDSINGCFIQITKEEYETLN